MHGLLSVNCVMYRLPGSKLCHAQDTRRFTVLCRGCQAQNCVMYKLPSVKLCHIQATKRESVPYAAAKRKRIATRSYCMVSNLWVYWYIYLCLHLCLCLQIRRIVNRGQVLNCPPKCMGNAEMYEIMKGCWNADPSARWPAKEIVKQIRSIRDSSSKGTLWLKRSGLREFNKPVSHA